MKKTFIMKIKLLVVLLSLLLSNTLIAQSFHGGFRAGANASEVSGDNLGGLDKFGSYFSAYTFYPIANETFLKLEVMYSEKGSRAIPSDKNQYYDYLFSLKYVEVPILVSKELSFITPHLKNSFFNIGVSLSKLAKYKELENGNVDVMDIREFKPLELNFITYFEYNIYKDLFVNFGYSNSLTPIRPHINNQKSWNNYGQYHSVWSLGISYIVF